MPDAIAIIVARPLRPMLLGTDPCDVEVLWTRMYDSMRVVPDGPGLGVTLDESAVASYSTAYRG